MKTTKHLALALSLLAVGAVTAGMFAGCSNEKNDQAASSNDDTKAALKKLPPDQQEALSKLSDDDLKLALEQKTCPVQGKALGSMGTPPKVTVKGQTVFVCCEACVDAVQDDPDKYIEKLEK